MLDRLVETAALLVAMQRALPFDVGLMPGLMAGLARGPKPVAVKRDEGGILCHISPSDADSRVVVSLTHVRVPRTLPFAAAALTYQKHRVKKLKQQQG
jgi:hypothetical protein